MHLKKILPLIILAFSVSAHAINPPPAVPAVQQKAAVAPRPAATTPPSTMTTNNNTDSAIKEDTTPPAAEGPIPASQIPPLLTTGKTMPQP